MVTVLKNTKEIWFYSGNNKCKIDLKQIYYLSELIEIFLCFYDYCHG